MRLIDRGELRHACRTLARSPAFLAISAGSLALGIAMSVTMFGVLDALVRPNLPVRDVDALYTVEWSTDRDLRGITREVVDTALLHLPAIAEVTVVPDSEESDPSMAMMNSSAIIAPGANLARGLVSGVPANVFSVLGARMRFGRYFVTAADSTQPGREVVISSRLWRTLYGARNDFAPFTMRAESKVFTVIGVAEPRLHRALGGDVWVAGPASSRRSLLRVARGVSQTSLTAALTPVAAALAVQGGHAPGDLTFRVRPLGAMAFPMLAIGLTVAALAVLLIACVNIANLQLARGLARLRDLAIRVAIGASRSDIVRLQAMESALVAALGGVGGLVLSVWGIGIVRATLPTEFDIFGLVEPQFSWRVLAAAIALASVSAVAFGLFPAIRVSRFNVNALLQQGAGTGVTRTSRGQYSALIAVEVAAAMALAICAALVGTSVRTFATTDPGYTRQAILQVKLHLDVTPAEAVERRASLKAAPDVASASFSIGAQFDSNAVTTDDPDVKRALHFMDSKGAYIVDADFFRTFGTPVRGPGFNTNDDGSTPLVVIDSIMAHELFGTTDPVGRLIKFGPPSSRRPWARVVGVSRHIRWIVATAAAYGGQAYVLDRTGASIDVSNYIGTQWFVRPSGNVRAAVASISERTSAGVVLFDEINGRNWIDRMIRFIAALFTAFGAVGLALAMIGVYGVLAHSVSQRRREFGVRIAFGATASDLMKLVLTQANVPVLTGLALGLLAAYAGEAVIGYFIAAFVSGSQVAVYVIAPLAIFAATLVAGLAPALRASKTSATQAIRGN